MAARESGMRLLGRVGLLCLIAGLVDAYAYVSLGHIFAANMTGNTVLLAVNAVRGGGETRDFIVTLGAFALGTIVGSGLKRATGRAYAPLLLGALLLIAAATVPLSRLPMLAMLAATMGLQAATVSQFGPTSIQTVVITTPIARLAEGLIDLAWPRRGRSAERSGEAQGLHGIAWGAYALGAACAAAVTGFWSTTLVLLLPANGWIQIVIYAGDHHRDHASRSAAT
jgi:uncharacterized membrane protein YoaK (UPF0700 family)